MGFNLEHNAPAAAPRSSGAPPSHTDASSGGYNFSRVAAYNRAQASAPPSHTDASSGGYDFARANAYKATPAYTNALDAAYAARVSQPLQNVKKIVNAEDEARLIRSLLGLSDHLAVGASFKGNAGKSAGGFDPVGVIANFLSPGTAHLESPLVDIGRNAVSDLINLPGSTITGAGDLIKAWYKDATDKFRGTGAQGPSSNVEKLAAQMWDQSMTSRLAALDFKGALQRFEQHPVYSGSELAGEYGLLGRAAGALGRSGALGEDVARAASTAAPDRELIPGVPGTSIKQHYSPNVATKALQVVKNRAMKPGERSTARALNKQVDAFHQVQSTAAQRAMETTVHDIRQAKPKSGVVAAEVPHVMQGVAGGPDALLEGLKALRDRYAATEAAHAEALSQGRLGLSPDALKAVQTHQANIDAFLAHPDVQAAFESAGTNAARQAELETQLAHYGLHVPAEMETRALAPYALTRIEGTQSIPLRSIPTERSLLARQALRGVGLAKKDLVDAQKAHIKLTSVHGDAEAQVLQAERAVAKAAKQEAQTRGFLTGRYGQARATGEPNAAALPADAATRLDRNVVTSDNALAVHQDLKAALKAARTERKQYGLDSIAAKEDALKAAKEEFQQVHKPYLHEKNSSRLMVEDPNAPLIRAGKLKGQRLRPLTNDEIKAHMDANGVPYASYVKATLGRPTGFLSKKLRRGGSKGPSYTGESTLTGAYTPGYGAIAKSQISSLRQILTAKMHDAFVNRFGIAAEDGRQFTDANVAQAAHDFEAQHGVSVTPMYSRPKALSDEQVKAINATQSPQKVDGLVARDSLEARKFDPNNPRGGNLVLVPTTQLERYSQHIGTEPILRGKYLSLGSPSVMSGLNRGFRNTVLPFSTKLFVMHGGENTTRLGLRAGLAAPVKLPAAFRLAHRTLGDMPDEARAQLEDLVAPGQHYGLQYNENLRHIEARNPETANVATQYARAAADAYGRFAQGVFSIHRAIERAGQKTMLGMHMQRELQELAGSTLKAHTAINQLREQLAHHYADPKVAEDAMHYVHAAGGQYNAFSPAMKYFIGRVAPFAPWYLNAAKFVYHTLPTDHPAAAALLYSAARAQPGVNPKDVPHDTLLGVPVGTLLSDIKTGPSSYFDAGRFTPAGITDPKAWADMLFPALNSTARAVYGLDPFWAPFKGPHGEGKDLGSRLGYGLNQLLESFGGPVAPLVRVFEGQGRTPYNTSTLVHPEYKPDSTKYGGGILGGLARTFNPLQSVTLKGKKSSGGLGHGSLGGGLGSATLR